MGGYMSKIFVHIRKNGNVELGWGCDKIIKQMGKLGTIKKSKSPAACSFGDALKESRANKICKKFKKK
jgi:hypothetical protein